MFLIFNHVSDSVVDFKAKMVPGFGFQAISFIKFTIRVEMTRMHL